MLVHKCDICKREIKKGNNEVVAWTWLAQLLILHPLRKTDIVFLKKRKLLEPAKTTGS